MWWVLRQKQGPGQKSDYESDSAESWQDHTGGGINMSGV